MLRTSTICFNNGASKNSFRPRFCVVGTLMSPFVRKVLATMHLKGMTPFLDYEIEPLLPAYANKEFLSLSPRGEVPLLIIRQNTNHQHHDGKQQQQQEKDPNNFDVIVDSTVICEYLEEIFPPTASTSSSSGNHCTSGKMKSCFPPISSPIERAQARFIEEFADTTLSNVIIQRLWYEKSYRKFVEKQPVRYDEIEKILKKELPQVIETFQNEFLLRKDKHQRETCHSTHSHFLFGDQPMLCDFSIASQFRNLELLKYDLSEVMQDFPQTLDYVTRVLHCPEMKTMRMFEESSAKNPPTSHRNILKELGVPIPISGEFCFSSPSLWQAPAVPRVP